jgi:ABC-2 type transport system permease protein/lipopolysaccharide transport system permease protein
LPADAAPAAEGLAIPEGLIIVDPDTIPSEPAPETFYRHRVPLFRALRATWGRREIVFALAERDVRTSYKQASLGMLWALISPVLQVVLFTLIFSHVKGLKPPAGVPYIIYSYVGLLCWGFFSGSLGSGGSSMVANLTLLQKTNFPRECFPLSQILEQTLYTAIGLIPLGILLGVHGFAPKLGSLWVPLILVVELLFTIGLTLMMAAFIVYVRDLAQVTGIILSLGLFATPIIWPLSKLSNISFGPFHHVDMRPYYSLFNPLGPVMDSVRRTALLNQAPDWKLLGLGALSACFYFVIGYRLFKRLEVYFADIS